jgi:carboxyl-terminal processing protease
LSKIPKNVRNIHISDKFKTIPKNAKTAINVAILLVIFGLGVGIGQGKIVFGSDAAYRKSVQKGSLPDNLDYSGVEELYSDLRQSYDGQLDATKLEDGLKEGLVKAAGDTYTEYLNQEASKDFDEQLSGSFQGIGAELGKEKQSIVIIAPIAGFPAEKAGLKSGDTIIEIDGQAAYDISISDAVKRIRGPKDTTVKLKVGRGDQTLSFEIKRDQIVMPSVKSEVTGDNVGVITVSRFGEDTVKLTTDAANDLKSKGVKGVVLDMRGNPGGLLDAAVGVSSLWLDNGQTILQEKRDGQVVKTFKANGDPVLKGMPTVVLIDGGSASASEITAGALRDNKVATIMGIKSYGKGSVQEVRQLADGGTLKVTIARWYTPNGRNIDKEGIEPDKKVEISADDINAKRDPQKDAAVQSLKQ